MATIVRRFLRILGFLAVFAFTSKMSYLIFGELSIISTNNAREVAGWFSESPAPEDIYDVFDYINIMVDTVSAIIFYSIIVQFLPMSRAAGKNVWVNLIEIVKASGVRIVKLGSTLALFCLFLTIINYDRYFPSDSGFAMAIVIAINIFLTVLSYVLLKRGLLKIKGFYGA